MDQSISSPRGVGVGVVGKKLSGGRASQVKKDLRSVEITQKKQQKTTS